MKFEIWQLHLDEEVARRVNKGERPKEWILYSDIRVLGSKEAVLKAWEAGMYRHVANIEAFDLEDVFETGNIGPEERIERLGPMHSVSVGDVVVGDGKWLCESIGWGSLESKEEA